METNSETGSGNNQTLKPGEMLSRQNPSIKEVAFITLYSDTNNELRRGTGFLVKVDEHFVVVTAAHCLYNLKEREWADYVHIFPGRETQNAPPIANIRLPYFYIPESYMARGSGNESDKLYGENDFGFIYLCQGADIPQSDWFELKYAEDQDIAKADKHITGYPKQEKDDGPEMFSQYSVQVANPEVDKHMLKYKNGTREGMDGSPCYYISGRKRYAFGVHVKPGSAAVRFTKEKVENITKAVKTIAALRKGSPRKSAVVCGIVWRPGYMAYRCNTCSIFKHSLFCHGCFMVDHHKGHNYEMQLCKTGGFCNCGDTDMLRQEGFCDDHGPKVKVGNYKCTVQ